MAFANGQYPSSALGVVKTAKGQMLRAEAAVAWDALADEVRRRYGWTPALTDSYRPYAVQERIFLDRYRTSYQEYKPGRVDRRSWRGQTWWRRAGTASASTPGLSNHGLGLAVDVTALGGFNGQRYRELASVAAAYGWSNATGKKIDEAWHWEFTGKVSAPIAKGSAHLPTPTVQEDDMPLDDRDLVKILEARFRISPDREVSLSEALAAVYYYGDHTNARISAIEERLNGVPAQVWSHPLPRTVGEGQVSTGDLLRYESAEHANTRAVVEAVAAVLPDADVDVIKQAVTDALAAGIQVNITTGGTP